MIKSITLDGQSNGENVSVYVVHDKDGVIDGVWSSREDALLHVKTINDLNPYRKANYTRTSLDSSGISLAIKAHKRIKSADTETRSEVMLRPCGNCEKKGLAYCHLDCQPYQDYVNFHIL
jgi:hypothetical protein